MSIPLFCLVAWGITEILTTSYLLEPVRDFVARHSGFFGTLVNCVMCVGFWVGFFLSFLFMGPAADHIIQHPPTTVWYFGASLPLRLRLILGALMDGAISSAACWMAFIIQARIFSGAQHEN